MNETRPNSLNAANDRKARIRALVKSLNHSRLVRFRIAKQGATQGTLEWSAGQKRLSAMVEVRADQQANGRCHLHLSPWPADLHPIVAYSGVPGICRINVLNTRFVVTQLSRDLFAVEHEPVEVWTLRGDGPRADGDDEDDEIEESDWEPEESNRGWIDLDLATGRLEVHAELEENADPGMIVVEIRWINLDGEEVRNQFTIELTECDDDDIWSGRLRVELPGESGDGQIWVTARSLTPEDVIELSCDERDGESSEVDRLIARSRFSLNGIQINEDRSEIIIGDVDAEQLEDNDVDEWLIQATTSASQTTDMEDTASEDESLPFKKQLQIYRDRKHMNSVDADAALTKCDEQQIWVEIYNHYRRSFPTWNDDQITEAISSTYLKLIENGLPATKTGDNLTGYLWKIVYRNLCGLHRREQRHHRKRENGIEISEYPEFDETDTATETIDLAVENGLVDPFIELLTLEEVGYWAMKNWLGFSDVDIREEMNLSEYRVRSLAEKIDRKLFVFQGLTWITQSSSLTREPLFFIEHEREVIQRYVFDGLDTDSAVSAVGLGMKNGRRLLRDAIQKVELAAAAWLVNLPEEYVAPVAMWFDSSINHSSNASDELTRIGRRLHAQIMLSTLPRKKLKKPTKKFLQHRIIERKSLTETFKCICSHYKSNIPSQEDLQAVPDDVVRCWNELKSAVPDCIRRITADWLCAH